MLAVTDVLELALSLSKPERGKLISRLIESLGAPVEVDEADWIAEALRRDKEMDEDPDCVLTHEEFKAGLAEFRR